MDVKIMNKEPLAYRLRTTSIDEVYGQEHLTDENGFIKRCLDNNTIFSMIFYEPFFKIASV